MTMLHKVPASKLRYDQGPFTIIPNFPGLAIRGHHDHGYGPLARYDESIMRPGTFIPMHEHRNDEIISYVSNGRLRHADRAEGRFTVGPHQLMVMNAGRTFWHEEMTSRDDPEARFLQIFIRPHTADLAPSVQLVDLGAEATNGWRFLAGPIDSGAAASVRNDVHLYDAHVPRGTALLAPIWKDWSTLIHVYRGNAMVNGNPVIQGEGALLVGEREVKVTASSDATILAFLINYGAPVTHLGTIGQ
jgi:quercetin 2,3-dioxygenase